MFLLDPVAAAFLLAVGVFIPFVSLRAHARLSRGQAMPARRNLHRGTLISLSLLTAFALWAAHRVQMRLFPEPRPDLTLISVTGAAVVGLWIVGAVRWRRRTQSPETRRRLVALLPRSGTDFAMWVALCVAAGVGEEIIYRAVLFGVLEFLTGSWPVAAVLTALCFGLAHATQGWGSIAITFVISLLAQWLVLRAGDLYLAMGAHFTYDLGAGIMYAAMARRAGLFDDHVPA